MFSYSEFYERQEYIPVGCVPPARDRTGGSLSETGLCLGGLCPGGLCLRGSLWGGLCPRGVSVLGGLPDRDPPLVNRMTNRCKNITLPQTSFAGGK